MYTLDDLKEMISKYGYEICKHTMPVETVGDIFFFKDKEGYIYRSCLDTLKRHSPKKLLCSNPFSIYNVNLELKKLNIDCVCVDNSYLAKKRMKFRCCCGELFYTRYNSLKHGKTKCDKCSGTHIYTYNEVKEIYLNKGYHLDIKEEEYESTVKKLPCSDGLGYKYLTYFQSVLNGESQHKVHSANPYSIDNIKNYIAINDIPAILLDTEYISSGTRMKFKCTRCGLLCTSTWHMMTDKTEGSHPVYCRNCDGTLESVHAVALKQIFMHEHPDTVVEDNSYVNPITNRPRPTDIVNHRLKIAIEVQSSWHDKKEKADAEKKNFWLEKGYSFYAPDIRDYSVLEMAKLFFDIEEIPKYVNLSISKRLNWVETQKLLDMNLPLKEVARLANISSTRISALVSRGDLHYSEEHRNAKYVPIVCFDIEMNLIKIFDSVSQAAREMNVNRNSVAKTIFDGNNYARGYYWQRLEDYNNGIPLHPKRNKTL